MVHELRIYQIKEGEMDAFLEVFQEQIMPTCAMYGVRVHNGWVTEGKSEFVWMRSYDTAEVRKPGLKCTYD